MIRLFCEECGQKLTPGTKFCEECGAPIPVEKDSNQTSMLLTIFQNPSWMSIFRNEIETCNGSTGILFTNSQLLSEELGISNDEALQIISNFILDRKSNGISYFLLDVSNNAIGKATDVESHIRLLENITQITCPCYLFIIGGNNIIPTQIYENEGKTDSDETVPSDLPYSTLDKISPWKGRKYDFENCMTVGRLPTYEKESVEEFKRYFENIKQYENGIGEPNTLGVSAEVWKNTSNHCFKKFSKGKVLTSPNTTKSNINTEINMDTNICYFNVHGAEDSDAADWYGQEGYTYPEAFSPKNITKIESPFVMGVEACYGARYINYKKNQSILLTSITQNCLSFLGSSKIAYGTCSGEGCCADIMIGTFLENIKKGDSAGNAFSKARKELTSQRNLDDTEIKTLAEFSLYGDPSYKPFGKSEKSFFERKSISKLCIPMPDVTSAVRLEIAKVDAQIEKLVNDAIYSTHPELENVVPDIYKNVSDGNYSAVYQKNVGPFNHIVKAYFNDCGQIYKEYTSK